MKDNRDRWLILKSYVTHATSLRIKVIIYRDNIFSDLFNITFIVYWNINTPVTLDAIHNSILIFALSSRNL